ncbi:protein phosphatase 1 regulatory subunit 7 isoform X2 [Pteropus medius]|uniref:protein phosphatase 1 regulatory subunit 7 isoform X2 n=1 Tax=Pteropus vampyrus TaxID=132908 RepID=UPI00196B0ED8|nr:protein phosphatase 1 regulatory subunit 7 isoform X2 [Pteropus giganteus]
MAAERGAGQQQSQEMMEEGQELPVDMDTISLDRDAEDVDLNHYRIGKIEGFEVLKKVKTLCLRQNLIKCIENLEELHSLRELDLYDNQIKKIENLDALTELEVLDISFNLLRNIEGVDKLTRLKKLFLVNNKINKIENISNLHQLQMLELGSNRIRAIENIDTLTSLESLFLGKNKITKLQNLDALSNLTVLSMQSNRLTKIEGLQGLVNLRELYLSHNGIEVLEGLENNNKLTMLDIASNRIKKIENVSHLTELQEFWGQSMGHRRRDQVGPAGHPTSREAHGPATPRGRCVSDQRMGSEKGWGLPSWRAGPPSHEGHKSPHSGVTPSLSQGVGLQEGGAASLGGSAVGNIGNTPAQMLPVGARSCVCVRGGPNRGRAGGGRNGCLGIHKTFSNALIS